MRKTASLSGPLSLPTRASANSLSAPIRSSGGMRIYLIITAHVHCFHLCTKKITCTGSLTLLVGFLYVLWHLNIIFLMLIVVDSPVDKSKRNVVEIKGRFSVTSENVDLAKVSELGGYWIQYFNMAQLSSISSRKFDKSLLSRFRTFQSAVSPASPQR